MKRETTKKEGGTSKKQMKIDWINCWDNMPAEKRHAWVERVYYHVKEVIRLEGGNEYKEGRLKGKEKKRVYD